MNIKRMIYLTSILGLLLPQSCGSKKNKLNQRIPVEAEITEETGEQTDEDAQSVVTLPTVASLQAYMGVRSFAEINATYATLTGVATTQTQVRNTYNEVRFSLPSETNDVRAFSGTHQAAILKLASQYCQQFLSDQTRAAEILKMPGTGNPIPLNQLEDNPSAKRALGRVFAERFWKTSAGMADFKVAEDEAEKLIDQLMATVDPASNNGQTFGGDPMPFAVCSAVLASFPTIER